jgi:predicted PurR-regulated permease PerM
MPEMLPLERSQSEEIFTRTRDVIDASLYGVLVIAMIQGALGGLAFWVLGLPSAIVWAVVMIFLSMIPMAGAFIVWVPAAIYLAATGHWVKALILVAWGVLVIGTIDNFLRPKLVGEKTRLHELFIFFSVLGGLKVFGVLGIVLGPVVLAITLALLDVFRQADRRKPIATSDDSLTEQAASVETDKSAEHAAD